MSLITQVRPISLGKWLCEVFVIGGSRVAYAETPKDREFMRPAAIYFVETMAHLCELFKPGKYNVYTNPHRGFLPILVAETDEQPGLEKIGEANLPKRKGGK